MHRFKMRRAGSAGFTNHSEKNNSSSSNNNNPAAHDDNNNNATTKRGRLMAGILFRRHKSESSMKCRNKKKEEETSRAMSDASSRSTLSMSLTSSGRGAYSGPVPSEDFYAAQRLSAVRGAAALLAKNETLQELPFEESEHSSGVLVLEEDTTATTKNNKNNNSNSSTTTTKMVKMMQTLSPPPCCDTVLPIDSTTAEDNGEIDRTSLETQESPASSLAPETPSDMLLPQTPEYLLEMNTEHPELGYLPNPFTDMMEACDYATRAKKPILALFSEPPGDEQVAEEIFSHPLLVEAIQSLFVLVVQEIAPSTTVRRTRTGRRCRAEISLLEASTLESLIASSLWGDSLTRQCLVQAMVEALEKVGNHVPKYLQVLQQKGEMERTIVWGTREPIRGEVECGTIPGVVSAKSCFLNRQPVCAVTYDPRRASYSGLLRLALQHSLCDSIYHKGNEERVAAQIELSRLSETASPTAALPTILPLQDDDGNCKWEDDSSSKQALRKTAMRFVPLTDLQSIMANQLIHQGRFDEAMRLLSPWQGQILMKAMRNTASFHDVTNVPIEVAWRSVCQQKAPCLLLLEDQPSPEDEDTETSSLEDEDDAQFGL